MNLWIAKQGSLELYEKQNLTENNSQLENIFNIIGKVYYDKQDFKMALFYYKKSLTIADDNNNPTLVSLLFNISQTHFQMNNIKYGTEYLRQCIEVQETLIDDENDPQLMPYKQSLSFSQLLLDAQKRKRKRRPKYKRLFHTRHYRRRKKTKTVLMISAEFFDLIAQFCE
ncbi:unnamed protein product [Didymodactylos carnosus]|uniref:Uncharacterized protein n=1 Tax=Didymodactylos carnosus TaxID=1234261 RepID=A0A8S2VAT8_9BILA|nr:unnamed protein product [Didymodactylos carnosus]CAF4389493.1 unnamed protein product [Didymodactylos carnosus]